MLEGGIDYWDLEFLLCQAFTRVHWEQEPPALCGVEQGRMRWQDALGAGQEAPTPTPG